MPAAALHPPLSPAQRALFDAHLRIVARVAHRMRVPSWHFDDACQDGAIGLMTAARQWDGTGNFQTYAWRRVRWSIIDEARTRSGWRRADRIATGAYEVSLASEAPGTEDVTLEDSLTLADPGRDPGDAAAGRVDAASRLAELVAGLNPSQRVVLAGIGAGLTLRVIGDQLGVTEARACQIRKAIEQRAGAL